MAVKYRLLLCPPEELEGKLNEWATQGWRVCQMERTPQGLLILLEREGYETKEKTNGKESNPAV